MQELAAYNLSREETRSSQASLIEVEPSPVDETPAEYGEDGSYFPAADEDEKDTTPSTPFLSRSGTLVGLGSHGPAFYCMSTLLRFVKHEILMCSSNTDTKILIVRLHNLRHLPHRKHIHNTAHHPQRPRCRIVPPPHTTLLPIPPIRASTCYRRNRSAYSLRCCAQIIQEKTAGA